MCAHGNKRKEKKNKKNAINEYKATDLRAPKTATKSAAGVSGILPHTISVAKAKRYTLPPPLRGLQERAAGSD